MKGIVRSTVAGAAALLLFAVPMNAVAVGPEVPVCTVVGAQRAADVSGRRVVWEDERSGSHRLWEYDLATGETRELPAEAQEQSLPAVDGSTVVAEGYGGSIASSVFAWNASSGPFTVGVAQLESRYEPDVFGDWIAWTDQRNGNDDIYAYNMVTGIERSIVTDGYRQNEPALAEKWIAWTDTRKRAGAWGDIYGYKLTSGVEQPICDDPSIQQGPAVSGDRFVWQDFRNGDENPDIYAYDAIANLESDVCTEPAPQSTPAISGHRAVWQDARNGDWDIYSFNFTSGLESAVCTAPGDQTMPAISGDWVVWQDTREEEGADIYAACLVPTPDLHAASATGPSAAPIGGPIGVDVTVANRGSASAPSSTVGLYLSVDSNVTRDDVRIGAAVLDSLAAGGSRTVTLSGTLPKTVSAGAYTLGAIADVEGDLLEPDEHDNTAVAASITVQGPANDSFSTPRSLSGPSGKRTDYTYGATRQTGEPKHASLPGSASVWYRFVPADSGSVTIDLAGSSFDTLVGVYTGSSVGGLARIASNDDVGARVTSKVTFSAKKGAVYYIAVDGYQSESGTVKLAWANKAKLSTPKSLTRVRRNAGFTVSGTITPRHRAGSKPVKLQFFRFSAGKWFLKKTVYVKVAGTASYSRYAKRVSLPTRGAWRVRAYHADGSHATSISPYRKITVR
ncbi:MAG: hypothetical protein HY876_01725 [Coriobacteriales bacterium]|nr:hypothetical protein [Coriobacteriales bacterium]